MYVLRSIKNKFDKVAKIYPIVALVGPRQAGKTTFLKEHAKEKETNYLLFDDPDIRELFEEDIKKFENQNIEGYKTAILDEVQYCRDSGKKLKYLADNGRNLWITSSSEVLLSKDVLSYLVGRVSILKLYPFSLGEFLNSKNQKELADKILQRSISEHIAFGGYPKVVLNSDIELKKTILLDLYNTMILKDISRTFSIEDINSLEYVSRYIAINTGSLINYGELSQKINISFQSIKKYLDAMERSYLIIKVQPFYTNKTKEIVKQPKIYFVDTGLRNIIAKRFDNEPEGKLFENYVASELVKLGFNLKYWRTKSKAEVDFIIESEKGIVPIEVKLNAEKIPSGLQSFIEEYKPKTAFVVTYKTIKKQLKLGNCNIIFSNIYDTLEKIKEEFE